MTPIVPAALPNAAPATAAPAPLSAPKGAEPAAAPPSEMGRAAVTQARATGATAPQGSTKRSAVADIPPDPPPLKGLGIPGLHTARVGDFDNVEDLPQPPAKAEAPSFLGSAEPAPPPQIDRRA